jgi:hypothetical protein
MSTDTRPVLEEDEATAQDIFWGYLPQARDLSVAELLTLSTDDLLAECARVRADLVAVVELCREARGAR